jgi:hypothetical protein
VVACPRCTSFQVAEVAPGFFRCVASTRLATELTWGARETAARLGLAGDSRYEIFETTQCGAFYYLGPDEFAVDCSCGNRAQALCVICLDGMCAKHWSGRDYKGYAACDEHVPVLAEMLESGDNSWHNTWNDFVTHRAEHIASHFAALARQQAASRKELCEQIIAAGHIGVVMVGDQRGWWWRPGKLISLEGKVTDIPTTLWDPEPSELAVDDFLAELARLCRTDPLAATEFGVGAYRQAASRWYEFEAEWQEFLEWTGYDRGRRLLRYYRVYRRMSSRYERTAYSGVRDTPRSDRKVAKKLERKEPRVARWIEMWGRLVDTAWQSEGMAHGTIRVDAALPHAWKWWLESAAETARIDKS